MLSWATMLFLLSVAPAAVLACEGDCIIGITDAFLGNYSKPITTVLETVGLKIQSELVPQELHRADPLKYLRPLITAYNNQSYASLEAAIFPGYFHGKCQVNGVDPAGCPDPDCPVVCGTPGSLIHFYSMLRSIAFNETQTMLRNLIQPASNVFAQILDDVNAARKDEGPSRRMVHMPRGSSWSMQRDVVAPRTSTTNVKAELATILEPVPDLLAAQCDESGSLSACSWETAMKAYILSFP